MDDLYLENIDEFVNDQNKIVSVYYIIVYWNIIIHDVYATVVWFVLTASRK